MLLAGMALGVTFLVLEAILAAVEPKSLPIIILRFGQIMYYSMP